MMIETQALKEVYDLAEAMNKYGPAIIILSVFIVIFLIIMMVFIKSFANSAKKTGESTDQMMRQQQQLIDHLLREKENEGKTEVVKEKNYDEKNIVGIFYKLNINLKSECKNFLEKTNCDRIGVYVFHNGTVASHGLPFFKVSCICECIKRGSGIQSHITDSTNLPLTLFGDIIEKLYIEEGGCLIVRNTVPGAFHSDSFFLDKDKAATAIFAVVYDSEDRVMAFVLSEYRSELNEEEISSDCKIYRDLCARLRPVLEFSGYQRVKGENEG